MDHPSSPPPPLLLPPPESAHQVPPSPIKKTQPIPWTHQETFNLIQAYQEKWYSLKKGQLKASQWEEVAITVAARCGFDEPSKSSTQCRHKIEKLRKRYRAERLKPGPNSWQFFDLMDRMERGPLPIAAHPVAMVKCHPGANNYSNHYSSDQRYNLDNSDDSDEVDVSFMKNKCKSINHMMGVNGFDDNNNHRNVNKMAKDRNFGGEMSMMGVNVFDNMNKMAKDRNFGGGMGMRGANVVDNMNKMAKDQNLNVLGGMRNSMNEKRKGYFENVGVDDDVEEEVDEEEDDEYGEGSVGGSELAAEIRGFAERFMRMENKKIEMMKETERYRMEMEKRRMEMILETQRNLVDTITSVIGSHKKMKMAQEF